MFIECRKEFRVYFGFALLRSVIGWQNSRHFPNREKPKLIVTCSYAFNRAWRWLYVFDSNSDWFIALFAYLLIGQSDYFGDVLSRSPGAFSFWMEKPVVPVGQQMEQSFPLEIIRKKRNNFRRISLFSFLPKWLEYHWTICLVTLTYHAPWWDTRFISQKFQWKEPFYFCPQRNNWRFHRKGKRSRIVLFYLAENFQRCY